MDEDGRRALGPRHPWEEMQTDPSVFQPPDEGELPAYMVDSNPLEVNRQTMESDGGAAVPWSGPEINHQKLTESWMARAQQQHARKAQGWGGGAEAGYDPLPPMALFCLGRKNPLRIACITIMRSKLFDSLMLVLILANCITLCLSSNRDGFAESPMGRALQTTDLVFLVLFGIELIIKCVAMGVVLSPGSYLRSGWNVMDATVVLLGVLDATNVGSYTALRAVRVLRPLRTITRIEGLKAPVVALFKSLPMLTDVAILCGFSFFVFGTVAVQLFAGAMHNRCSAPDLTYASLDAGYYSNISYQVAGDETFCSGYPSEDVRWKATGNSSSPAAAVLAPGALAGGGWVCPLEPTADTPLGSVCAYFGNPNSGMTSFDNILWAWVTIFQCVTQEGWTDVMYAIQDAISPWVWIYFVAIILFGSFFIINLALAVLYLQFCKGEPLAIASGQASQKWTKSHTMDAGSESDDDRDGPKRAAAAAAAEPGAPGAAAADDNWVIATATTGQPEKQKSSGASQQPGWDAAVARLAAEQTGEEGTVMAHVTVAAAAAPRKAPDSGPTSLDGAFSGSIGMLKAGLFRQWSGSSRQQQQEQGEGTRPVAVTQPSVLARLRHSRAVVGLAAAWAPVQAALKRFVKSTGFQWFNVLVILANTGVLAATSYPMDPTWNYVNDYINYGFTVYFTLEMLLKWAALGPVGYFRKRINQFDALVVAASLTELIVDLLPGSANAGGLSVLRTFRLLRILKLARNWKELQRILNSIIKSIVSVCWLSLLLLLFMFVFALMGMQLFGWGFAQCDVASAQQLCPPGLDNRRDCPYHYDCYVPCDSSKAGQWFAVAGSPYNNMAYCEAFPRAAAAASSSSSSSNSSQLQYWAQVGKAANPRSNFDSIGWALYTVFQILTAENWNNIMYSGMVALGPAASLFFIAVVIVGNYMLLNLFLAVLLENFGNASDSVSTASSGEDFGLGQAATSALFFGKMEDMLRGSWFGKMMASKSNKVVDGGDTSARRSRTMSGRSDVAEVQTAGQDPKQQQQQPQLALPAPEPTGTNPRQQGQQQQQPAVEASPQQRAPWGPQGQSSPTAAAAAGGVGGRLLPGAGDGWAPEPAATGRRLPPLAQGAALPGPTLAQFSVVPQYSGGLAPAHPRSSPELLQLQQRMHSISMLDGQAGMEGSVSPQPPPPLQQQQQQTRAPPPPLAVGEGLPNGGPGGAAAAAAPLPPTPSGLGALRARAAVGGSPLSVSISPMPAHVLGGNDGEASPKTPRSAAAAAALAADAEAFARKSSYTSLGSLQVARRSNLGDALGAIGGAALGALGMQASGPSFSAPSTSERMGSRLSMAAPPLQALAEPTAAKSTAAEVPSQPTAAAAGTAAAQGKAASSSGDAQNAWGPEQDLALEGTSCFLLGPRNPLRLALHRVISHSWFEGVLIVCILISSLTLALDSPNLAPDSKLKRALDVLDIVFTVVFSIEAVLKILVKGVVFTGPDAYMRNAWNVLDFIVVVTALVTLGITASGGDTAHLSALRALRTLRALRPLRMVARLQGMKVVVSALFASIPPLGNVLLVCLLFYFIFGIMAIDLFAGGLANCQDSSGARLDPDYVLPAGTTMTRDWCEGGPVTINASAYHSQLNVTVPEYNLTRGWVNPTANFDNILNAMVTLFTISTTELWVDTTMAAVDAVGPELQPVTNHNPGVAVFFVVFVCFGAFFILQLFVSVTLEKFEEIAKGGAAMLTAKQEQWLTIQRMMAATDLEVQPQPPEGFARLLLYQLVTSQVFEAVVIGFIMANMILLAMTHQGMSQAWQDAMSYANLAFTIVFALEALLKLVAFGPWQYIRDNWCRFDLVVVLVSIVGCAIDLATTQDLPYLPLLRVLRMVRIFRLIPKAKGLRTLLQTLMFSLPALGNVGSVLFLFFFIYAIIGMNLFGTMKWGVYLGRHAHFGNMPMSLLTLFRMITGECWNGIMQDCMVMQGCWLVLQDVDLSSSGGPQVAAGTYLDPGDALLQQLDRRAVQDQCSPSPVIAVIYFCSFVLLCGLILVNFVIGVIIDNMQSSAESEELPISRHHLMQYQKTWAELDPQATHYIPAINLSSLICELSAPMGVKDEEGAAGKLQSIIMALDIPIRDGKIHFLETLHGLAGRVAGTEVPEDEELPVHERLANRLPSSGGGVPKYTVAHYYAALHVQAAIKGFLQRHALATAKEAAQQQQQQQQPGVQPR